MAYPHLDAVLCPSNGPISHDIYCCNSVHYFKFLCLYSFLHPITENQCDFHGADDCEALYQGLSLAPTCACPWLLMFLCLTGVLAGYFVDPFCGFTSSPLPPETLLSEGKHNKSSLSQSGPQSTLSSLISHLYF